MTNIAPHTPTPYHAKDGAEIYFTHPNGRKYCIARIFSGILGNSSIEAQATAAFICKAVNCHAEMMHLLEVLLPYADSEYETLRECNKREGDCIEEMQRLLAIIAKSRAILAKAKE